MEILSTMRWGAGIEEMAFVLSLAVVSFFYTAFKSCEAEIEKEKMLDNFLKE